MNKKLLFLIPYAIAMGMVFYLLPLLIFDTGLAMIFMLFIIPCLVFICSAIYGIRHGFNLFIALVTIVLFIPTVFIFYNLSAWIYIVIYPVLSLVGNGIGNIFYKKEK